MSSKSYTMKRGLIHKAFHFLLGGAEGSTTLNTSVTARYVYQTNPGHYKSLYNEWYCLFLILHIYTDTKDNNSSKRILS